MLWYAETAARRGRQITSDLAMIVWTVVWWRIAGATHDLVAAVGAPGRTLATTGERLAAGFTEVAGTIGGAPVVGGALGAPFNGLANAAAGVAAAGTAQDVAAGALADWVGALLLVVTVGVVGALWLSARVRGARRAGAARRLRDGGHEDLLALRALATRPVSELLAVTDDPVAAWRSGATADLAALELRRAGLRGSS